MTSFHDAFKSLARAAEIIGCDVALVNKDFLDGHQNQ